MLVVTGVVVAVFGAQVVPVKRYEGVVMDHGLGITQACMAMTSFSDAPAPNSGLSAVGEIRLMPDISTRRRLPWYDSVSFAIWSCTKRNHLEF